MAPEAVFGCCPRLHSSQVDNAAAPDSVLAPLPPHAASASALAASASLKRRQSSSSIQALPSSAHPHEKFSEVLAEVLAERVASERGEQHRSPPYRAHRSNASTSRRCAPFP